MSFGYQRQPQIFVGDSNDLTAYLYLNLAANDPGEGEDQELWPKAQISGAVFSIQRPQDPPGTFVTVTAATPADGTATATAPATWHTGPGQYVGVCTFTYGPVSPFNQKTTSVPIKYNVVDAYEASGAQPYDPAVDQAWQWFEDIYDSEMGGPHLRDETMGRFDKSRIRTFAGQVLFDINTQQPQTNYSLTGFDYVNFGGTDLFAQGFVVHTIRHLIRSYAEQPTPANSPNAYFDRRDYVDRWSAIYKMELDRYKIMLDYYKRHLLDVGTKALVSSKNGRGIFPGLRSRGVWRGYY